VEGGEAALFVESYAVSLLRPTRISDTETDFIKMNIGRSAIAGKGVALGVAAQMILCSFIRGKYSGPKRLLNAQQF